MVGSQACFIECRWGNGLVAGPVSHVPTMDGYPILRYHKALKQDTDCHSSNTDQIEDRCEKSGALCYELNTGKEDSKHRTQNPIPCSTNERCDLSAPVQPSLVATVAPRTTLSQKTKQVSHQ